MNAAQSVGGGMTRFVIEMDGTIEGSIVRDVETGRAVARFVSVFVGLDVHDRPIARATFDIDEAQTAGGSLVGPWEAT